MTAKLLIALIRVYQLTLSPFLGGSCRFLPTCSAYAIEAISTHGARRGALLAAASALAAVIRSGGPDSILFPPSRRRFGGAAPRNT